MSDIIKDKKIEKAVKKLISEEWLASTFYEQMILACDPNERDTIADIFRNHANDEKYDHYEKLISFAISNTLEIPCKLQEYDRYSDESLVKLIEKFQKGKKANYYIE